MDHLLTEHGLCLTYLQDARTIGDLDQERIIDDMSDDTSEGDPLPWLTRYRLAEYDHLVLVTDRSSGRYLAFLGANDGATERENFLLLEAAFVTRSARGQNLMRRMIALALLRIGGIGPTPSVVAACSRNPLCYRVMHETARRFTGVTFFPDPGSIAIDFVLRHWHGALLARLLPINGSRQSMGLSVAECFQVASIFTAHYRMIRGSIACSDRNWSLPTGCSW